MTEQHYYYGTGKRKTAVAQVRLYPGHGEFSIDGKTLEDAFPWPAWQSTILEPMKVTDNEAKFSVVAKLHGGGVTSQAGALRHGITRALLLADGDLRSVLKKHGFITRDSRIKESKKYGLKRARRAPQYTKR